MPNVAMAYKRSFEQVATPLDLSSTKRSKASTNSTNQCQLSDQNVPLDLTTKPTPSCGILTTPSSVSTTLHSASEKSPVTPDSTTAGHVGDSNHLPLVGIPKVNLASNVPLNTLSQEWSADGFRRFRATDHCGDDRCPYRSAHTTHFHCMRLNCGFSFKVKSDMEKHNMYHQKDDEYMRDGFRKFMKYQPCPFASHGCSLSNVANHIHCMRPGCQYILHSSGQLQSHRRKHERDMVLAMTPIRSNNQSNSVRFSAFKVVKPYKQDITQKKDACRLTLKETLVNRLLDRKANSNEISDRESETNIDIEALTPKEQSLPSSPGNSLADVTALSASALGEIGNNDSCQTNTSFKSLESDRAEPKTLIETAKQLGSRCNTSEQPSGCIYWGRSHLHCPNCPCSFFRESSLQLHVDSCHNCK